MRSNFIVGTALTTILAGLAPAGSVWAQDIGASKSGQAFSQKAPEAEISNAALVQQLEETRLQTMILAQAMREMCDAQGNQAASCALVAQLQSAGPMQTPATLEPAFAAGGAADDPAPIQTVKSPSVQTAAAPGPLSAANVSAGCAGGGGTDSTQCGIGADARGLQSTAVGSNSTADSDDATAIGEGAQATAENTVAVGQGAEASAEWATAVGESATASSADAVAVGNDALADAEFATALGGSAL